MGAFSIRHEVAIKASQEAAYGAGTEVSFALSAEEDQRWVEFAHSGWREDTGMFAHCSTKWAVFLLSLKDLLETGTGRPAPDDVPINHG